MNTITKLLRDVQLPRMFKAIQRFDCSSLEDIPTELRKQLSRPEISNTIRPGMSIAITCGSRGIDNYPLVLREIVSYCKQRNAKPFIIPAMGSHGGAVAEGQKAVCEAMGVTEGYCGCPIRATMEVTQIGMIGDGSLPVYIDSYAAQADGIIVVNRIKSHTSFRGKYESGLMKMMAIGLGKQYGASVCHRSGYKNMAKLIAMIGNTILKDAPVLFGVGLVENAYDKTCRLATLTKQEIPHEEPKLLEEAKAKMPRLLPGRADVLIIDRMGKNISGTGMDPNITGRTTTYAGESRFYAGKIAVLDVTPESHGSIHGVGYADVINKRVFEKGNLEITYPNAITSTNLAADKIPMMMKNDQETIQCAIKTCNAEDPVNPWVIRIKDTLHISEIWVSECMIESLKNILNLTVTDEVMNWEFDEHGNLF
jgi:hypothetical protein